MPVWLPAVAAAVSQLAGAGLTYAGQRAATRAQQRALGNAAAADNRAAGEALAAAQRAAGMRAATYGQQIDPRGRAFQDALTFGTGNTSRYAAPTYGDSQRSMWAMQDPNATNWAESVRRNPALDPLNGPRARDWAEGGKARQRAAAAGFDVSTPAGRAEATVALYGGGGVYNDKNQFTYGELISQSDAEAAAGPQATTPDVTRDDALATFRGTYDYDMSQRRAQARTAAAADAQRQAQDRFLSIAGANGSILSGQTAAGLMGIAEEIGRARRLDDLTDEERAYSNWWDDLSGAANRSDSAMSNYLGSYGDMANATIDNANRRGRTAANSALAYGDLQAQDAQNRWAALGQAGNAIAQGVGDYFGRQRQPMSAPRTTGIEPMAGFSTPGYGDMASWSPQRFTLGRR